MEAVCPDSFHEPPCEDCKCGIWTVSDPALLHEVTWTVAPPQDVAPLPGLLVVGQVALWGRVIAYDRGWRGSHSYPRQLYLFTFDVVLAAGLRDKYLVPVEYGEKADLLRQLLPPVCSPAAPAAPAASITIRSATPQ